MKSLYILLLAIAVSVASCKTKEGEPGPAGESGLAQQGKVSGTLDYKDHDGNSVSIPFEYSYYESITDNQYNYEEIQGGYLLNFFRRSLKDNNNFVTFSNLAGGKANGQFTAPLSGSFEFSLVKVMGNDLFEFNGYFDASNQNSTYTITNFFFDPTTGRTTFDFELSFDPSSIGYEGRYDDAEYATVTGKIDVILNRTKLSSPQVE